LCVVCCVLCVVCCVLCVVCCVLCVVCCVLCVVCCVLCVVCCVLCVVCCVLCVIATHNTPHTTDIVHKVCTSFAAEFASMSFTWSTGAITRHRKEIADSGDLDSSLGDRMGWL